MARRVEGIEETKADRQEEERMRAVTSPGQKAGLILGGVLACLVLIELGLRLGGWWYDRQHPLPQGRGADYKIFCVGESTTFGVGAPDPLRDNYPRQLESLLNQRFPGRRIQCLYDQSIGLNTSQLLMDFPSRLEQYRPDLVIFMSGVNNWWNLNKSNGLLFNRNDAVWRFSFAVLGVLDELRVFKLLKWIAYSNQWVRFESDLVLEDNEVNADPVHMKDWWERSRRVEQGIEARYDRKTFYRTAEHDLRQMLKLCRDRKVRAVICTYPGRAAKELSAVHRSLAREFGVVLVDNDALFNALPDKPGYFSLDGVHPNQKGYRELAGNIFQAILEQHLIPEQ